MTENAPSRNVTRLVEAIANADAIVVGAGAGMSTAAGFTYSGERFQQLFPDFIERYGFTDMYSAGFYPYPTPEEHWAYWSRYIWCNRYEAAPKDTYGKLLRLLEGKGHFVLTTNVDHQFQVAGFPGSGSSTPRATLASGSAARPATTRPMTTSRRSGSWSPSSKA